MYSADALAQGNNDITDMYFFTFQKAFNGTCRIKLHEGQLLFPETQHFEK